MKNCTHSLRLIILLLGLFFSKNIHAQIPNTEGFEGGSFAGTIWNDGGGDCDIDNGSILSGTYSAELRDNSGDNSSMYTDDLDLSTYESITITYDFRSEGFNNNHDYFIEFSNDGSTWQNVKTYVQGSGNDFQNSITYTNESVTFTDAVYTFNSTSSIRFRADANGNDDLLYLDNINIDGTLYSISCGTTITSFPYNESFESGLGDWTQDTGDDFDWTRLNGGTPSPNTGPSNAADGNWHLYTEASYGNNNNSAYLISPCFDLTSMSYPEFSLNYHMYGADMGTLNIDISTDDGLNYTNIWSLTGQVQTSNASTWEEIKLNLIAYSGQQVKLRVHGITGNDYTSDIAIDAISLINITPGPEINITSNSNNIFNNDFTPSVNDNTDFGVVSELSPKENNYIIENFNGLLDLNISNISLSNTTDFAITGSSYNSTITPGNSTSFNITFTPISEGVVSSIVTILNDDGDEPIYSFQIEGNGKLLCPTFITSFPYSESFESGTGDWTQDTGDDFDWTRLTGSTPSPDTGSSIAADGNWYLYTEASYGNTTNSAYLISPCFDLTGIPNPEFSFAYHMFGADIGTLYVDISLDNGANYTNLWSQSGEVQGDSSDAWAYANINLTTYSGQTIKLRFNGLTGTSYKSDIAIDDISLENFIPAPEIEIQGGSSIEIADGDSTPDYNDDTNFGIINIGSPFEQTFTIDNSDGTSDLTISSLTLSNTTDFSITGAPYSSPVPAGGSTTFSITYNALTTGTQTSTVTVNNNDADESIYDFVIEGSAVQYFYDSDGDGILDNTDVDDDNDGILDTVEEISCEAAGGTNVNYKFLNETFGVGTGRSTIDSNNYSATTTYNYEDASSYPTSGWILDDGEYVVVSKVTRYPGDPGNIDNIHGDLAWYQGDDHTPGDTEGRMAVFNASFDTGVFYETTITGILSNLPITYSFWALNIMTPGNFSGSILPNITVQFLDLDENELATFNTGEFGICTSGITDNSCAQAEWHEFTTSVNLGNTNSFIVRFINNAPGGGGNDLAIDDIIIAQTLCDTDDDGIADVFDLDSDNDGLPDVVEAGLGDYSEGSATLSNTAGWMDTNSNGMNDVNEGHIVLDTDGDGTPNFIDLDSDNDTIFDVDESGAGNSADGNYQNGDGDITGDGVGDGPDSDTVRIKDEDYDNVVEYFADGILDIYDYYSGGTMATAYGNENQGLGSTYYALDTDNDGNPDYMDVTSDGSTFDISHTLYADLDTNNNGSIGGINYLDDSDKDGILDLFDTDDINFGSPRDLDRKLHLYFDGRNDYSAESSVIDGWGAASMMAWIKVPSTPSGNQIILGQDEFYLEMNSSMEITAHTGENSISNGFSLETNRWYHIAATYSSTDYALTIYINGEPIDNAVVLNPLSSDASSFTIGRKPDTDSNYFEGYIDEVRVFNKALSDNELQKMVYQEIDNYSGLTRGAIIPLDITDFIDESTITPLNWTSLERYYRMDVYKDDIIDDLSTASTDIGTGMKIFNTKLIDVQTAPLPFITQQSGSLETAVDIPANGVHGQDVIDYDWSIVQIAHDNVNYNGDQKHVGLFVNELDNGSNPITFNVENDSELNVSWYLKLDGLIDLEGESQLIQGADSNLDVTSIGKIEQDQQGTADKYTYNYWSSPVGGNSITSNNNLFTLPNIIKDGTNPLSPSPITFITSGYDGTTSPSFGIADYWIWKFANQEDGDYSSWQHVRSTGDLLAGEGFTMKGPGSGTISQEQNYVFNGKPNNGTISLSISAWNDYLVGNPYPSAIDANQFILDNGPTLEGVNGGADPGISGTLYFWEHWGGGSHALKEYQGGYATYNLSGGTVAVAKGTPDADVAQIGVGTKVPGRYIPVGQGFFVVSDGVDGTINFNNGQRVFQKESDGTSLFLGPNNETVESTDASRNNLTNSEINGDSRLKIKIGLNSVNSYHRQLLVTADENATMSKDWGYDAVIYDPQSDDMFWTFDNEKFVIQGVDKIDTTTILPIGIQTDSDGNNSITIEDLENAANDLEIYLHDKALNIYHDLKDTDYDIYLPAGEYLDRFEITFSNQNALDIEDSELSKLDVHFANANESIVLINPTNQSIKSIEMINIIGQTVHKTDRLTNENYKEIRVKNLSSGAYIIKITTPSGTISKKVLVE